MMLQRKAALLAGTGLLVLAAPIALVAANPAAVVAPVAPAPAPSAAPAPAETAAPAGEPASEGAAPSEEQSSSSSGSNRLPTLEELEALDTDELDELFGLRPTYDIPNAQRRATTRVGILAEDEGGLPATSLARQPQSIVRAALTGTQGRLVSRWGHIALRRALASRLAAPEGMSGVEFAGLRAQLLNRMGEFGVARAIAQDVDVDGLGGGEVPRDGRGERPREVALQQLRHEPTFLAVGEVGPWLPYNDVIILMSY